MLFAALLAMSDGSSNLLSEQKLLNFVQQVSHGLGDPFTTMFFQPPHFFLVNEATLVFKVFLFFLLASLTFNFCFLLGAMACDCTN